MANKGKSRPRGKPAVIPRIDKSTLYDTYTREPLMRLREEEYQKSCAKSAESSKRKKLRP